MNDKTVLNSDSALDLVGLKTLDELHTADEERQRPERVCEWASSHRVIWEEHPRLAAEGGFTDVATDGRIQVPPERELCCSLFSFHLIDVLNSRISSKHSSSIGRDRGLLVAATGHNGPKHLETCWIKPPQEDYEGTQGSREMRVQINQWHQRFSQKRTNSCCWLC